MPILIRRHWVLVSVFLGTLSIIYFLCSTSHAGFHGSGDRKTTNSSLVVIQSLGSLQVPVDFEPPDITVIVEVIGIITSY